VEEGDVWYYAKVTVDLGEDSPKVVTTKRAKVTVLPRNIYVKPGNQSISYGDEVSAYTLLEDVAAKTAASELLPAIPVGMADGESIAPLLTLFAEAMNSDYEQWDDVKYAEGEVVPYAILVDRDYFKDGSENKISGVHGYTEEAQGFTFGYGNYTVHFTSVSADLAVNPLAAAEYEGLSYDYEKVFEYNGTAKTPAVEITDSLQGKNLSEESLLCYQVGYVNNINVSTEENGAKVIVTFGENKETGRANYVGVVELPFTIVRQTGMTATVCLKDMDSHEMKNEWTFGQEGLHLVADTETISNGEKTYYYKRIASLNRENNSIDTSGTFAPNNAAADFSTTDPSVVPTHAGYYAMWVCVAEDDKYAEIVSETSYFTILPRTITLTAHSDLSFVYDGNVKTLIADKAPNKKNYDQDGEFAAGDGFSSILVTGSRINAGYQDTVVTYVLLEDTEGNYEQGDYIINNVKGQIYVAPQVLEQPSHQSWNTANAGEASWIGITRSKLEVSYKALLYRVTKDENGQTVYSYTGKSKTTTDSYISLMQEIREDEEEYLAENDELCGYTMFIQTLPTGGENQENYTPSEIPEEITAEDVLTPRYLVRVVVEELDDTVTEGTTKITYVDSQGVTHSEREAIVFPGEIFKLSVTQKTGYNDRTEIWTVLNDQGEYVSFMEPSSVNTQARIRNNDYITAPMEIHIASHGKSNMPKVQKFEVKNYTNEEDPSLDYSKIQVNLRLTDEIGLRYWGLAPFENLETQVNTYDIESDEFSLHADGESIEKIEDGENGETIVRTYTYTKTADTLTETITGVIRYFNKAVRYDIPRAEDGSMVKDYSTTYEGTLKLDEGYNNYFLYAGDDLESRYTYYMSSQVNAYKITFDGNGGTGSMAPIYKVKNQPIAKLPVCTFTKEGYYLKNWESIGSKGLYRDEGSYALNRDDTLKAHWTNQLYNYTVEYYLMNDEGTYNEAATEVKELSGRFEATIVYDQSNIQYKAEGYTLDTELYGEDGLKTSIILDDDHTSEEERTLRLYYKRGTYKLYYQYTDVDSVRAVRQRVILLMWVPFTARQKL